MADFLSGRQTFEQGLALATLPALVINDGIGTGSCDRAWRDRIDPNIFRAKLGSLLPGQGINGTLDRGIDGSVRDRHGHGNRRQIDDGTAAAFDEMRGRRLKAPIGTFQPDIEHPVDNRRIELDQRIVMEGNGIIDKDFHRLNMNFQQMA